MVGRRSCCAECGEPLVPSGTGRPPKYCSTVCVRSAEYAMRRAQSLLRRAEAKLQDLGSVAAVADQWERRAVDKRLAFWEAEVERLRVELRAGLAGGVSGEVVEKPA